MLQVKVNNPVCMKNTVSWFKRQNTFKTHSPFIHTENIWYVCWLLKPGPHSNAAPRLSGVPRCSPIVQQRSDNGRMLPNASAPRWAIDAAFECGRGLRARYIFSTQVIQFNSRFTSFLFINGLSFTLHMCDVCVFILALVLYKQVDLRKSTFLLLPLLSSTFIVYLYVYM